VPTKIEPGEILARNPQIDPERLEQARDMLRRLREMGWPRRGYELAPPFRGSRVAPDETPREDPRLVRLVTTEGSE
jgi:hypothetical protein